MGEKWTKREDDILRSMWPNDKKEDILRKLYRRTWASLILRSQKIQISRDSSHINVNGTKKRSFVGGVSFLYKLLEETNEAYYWAGFIAADGHININKHRLKLVLSLKDLTHLQKFASFINCDIIQINKNKNYCCIQIQDAIIIKEFANKFKFCNNKTHNLKDPEIKDDDKFLSFMAGFIDGDGQIKRLINRGDAHISVVGHKDIIGTLQKWFVRIFEIFPATKYNSSVTGGILPKIDRAGYARGGITNFDVVKAIKTKMLQLNIPLMERKWNKIDIDRVSRYARGAYRRVRATELNNQGLTREQIATQLNIKITTTYNYF